jgi:hypothetical protein
MAINVIAGGDSFIWGSELADCDKQCSKNTFAALLAKDCNYECVAWPSFGNDSIARTVITKCESIQRKNIIVIVNWTFPSRYEFRFNYDTKQRTSPWYSIGPWTIVDNYESIKKTFVNDNDAIFEAQVENIRRAKKLGLKEFAKQFYKHVGNSEFWETYTTLKEVVHLQNYLTVNNIPFLFTCVDNVIFRNYTISLMDPTITGLHNQIKFNDWFWFPPGTNIGETLTPRGFYQWAIENKYKIGTTHPLEDAHKDAAQLMQEKFNELVKKLV